MEITKEITKEVFERYCPAAKSPERNTSVFNRVLPLISEEYETLINEYVGEEFKEKLEALTVSKDRVMRYVCNAAFHRAITSLDLVLTGTGFGIVNTNDTSPASQARVQALKEDVEKEICFTISFIITALIKIDGWGKSEQAKHDIQYLYWAPANIAHFGPFIADKSFNDIWKIVCTYRQTAESKLEVELSPEYYHSLIEKIRNNEISESDRILYNKCMAFEVQMIVSFHNGAPLPEPKWYGLRDYMEQHIDSFPAYKESKLYAYLHGEKYENKQEDNIFAFVN